jgi:hypothetical protein
VAALAEWTRPRAKPAVQGDIVVAGLFADASRLAAEHLVAADLAG